MMGKKEELEKADTGKMTDTQSENWLSWDQVIDIYKQLDNKVNTFYKLKKITDEQYSELLSYALLSLYIHQQPRRNKDYQLMRVVDAFTTDLDTKFNYISIILKNGYTETYLENEIEKVCTHNFLSIVKRKHYCYHRIDEIKGKTLTLFIAYGKYEWNAFNTKNETETDGIYQRFVRSNLPCRKQKSSGTAD
jgi:hypothetical protein